MFIKWFGLDKLSKAASRETVAWTTDAVGMALMEEAQVMFRNSQRRVPVDTGTLRRSGVIMPLQKEGKDWVVEMGYGGAAEAYALIQHERPDFRHSDGHTWKYLEGPVRERLPNLEKRIANRVSEIVRSNV